MKEKKKEGKKKKNEGKKKREGIINKWERREERKGGKKKGLNGGGTAFQADIVHVVSKYQPVQVIPLQCLCCSMCLLIFPLNSRPGGGACLRPGSGMCHLVLPLPP